MSSSTGWSDLPPDLLHAISTRLPSYLSFLRFRAVSRHFLSSSLPPIPSAPLPSSRQRCCGSSHGWLVLLNDYPTITLLNPLTSHKLHLPPLSAFPNVLSLDFSTIGREYTLQNRSGLVDTLSLHQMRDSFLKKNVLSSSPRSREGFSAMAILSQNGELGYCRNGGKEWSIVEGLDLCCEDVVCMDNGLFYAVDKMGCVVVCDVGKARPEVSVIGSSGVGRRGQGGGGDLCYLVGFEKELLLVFRFLDMVYDE